MSEHKREIALASIVIAVSLVVANAVRNPNHPVRVAKDPYTVHERPKQEVTADGRTCRLVETKNAKAKLIKRVVCE